MSASPIIHVHATWPQASIIDAPLTAGKKSGWDGSPRVLVRRNPTMLRGPHGEDIFYINGCGTVISLFTGAGGMDLGLEMASMVTLCQHEWMPEACETLIANRPRVFANAALIQGDIRRTPTEMILREAGLRVGECHIVCGGPPCQGFSTANSNRKRGETEGDARNDLVFEFLRVVNEVQPQFFIMENVAGLLSFNKGSYFKAFLERAYGCFYELVYGLVNAAEYHVPQYRTRFICMGTRRDLWACDGMLAGLPKPECFHQADLDKIQAFARMPLWGEELELLQHPPGIRYFPDRPVLVPPQPIGRRAGDDDEERGRSKSFINFYRRLRREEPDRIVNAPRGGVCEEPGPVVTVGEAIGDLPPLRSGIKQPRARAKGAA